MADVSEDGFISNEELKSLSEVYKGYTYFKKNDVLLAKITPCFENGKAAIADNINCEVGFGSSEFHVLRASDEIDPKFLFYLLWNEPLRATLSKKMTGSAGQKRVPTDLLKKLKIPLPSLEEQKAIVAKLDRAQRLIDIDKAMLAKYDQLIQSVFLEMFGDPVTNEKRWEVKKLGGFCGVGSSKRVFVKELVEDGIPFYRGTEVGKLGEGLKIYPKLFITKEHYEALKEHTGIPKIGDLLMPSICPDGRIFMVENESPFYFKDGRVLWVKAGESEINSFYLRYHLKALFNANYHEIASGTTFAELKIFALKDLGILYPPIDVQNEFQSRIEKIKEEISTTKLSLKKSQELFSSLVQEVFG